MNKTLLYRDEMVKKVVHQLASPCYSVVLTSPQTALTVAHARKEMVKLTLAAEGKVTVKAIQSLSSSSSSSLSSVVVMREGTKIFRP